MRFHLIQSVEAGVRVSLKKKKQLYTCIPQVESNGIVIIYSLIWGQKTKVLCIRNFSLCHLLSEIAREELDLAN